MTIDNKEFHDIRFSLIGDCSCGGKLERTDAYTVECVKCGARYPKVKLNED